MREFTIRQLGPDDWENYKNLRLESLVQHPAYFSPSRDETKFSEADWRERLSNINAASFGLFENTKMVGLTGAFKEKNDPQATRVHFVSSYIKAEYRKKGLSKLFFESRIAWVKEQKNVKAILTEIRDDNVPSQKANEKFGFQLVDSTEQEWPDGKVRPCLTYELELE